MTRYTWYLWGKELKPSDKMDFGTLPKDWWSTTVNGRECVCNALDLPTAYPLVIVVETDNLTIARDIALEGPWEILCALPGQEGWARKHKLVNQTPVTRHQFGLCPRLKGDGEAMTTGRLSVRVTLDDVEVDA
jgi:hypothetical protein